MIRFTHWLLLIALLSTTSACQPTTLPAEAFVTYVADPTHHLCQLQQVGSTEVSVAYQPTDLLVMRELQGQQHSQTALDSLRKKYSGTAFFLLSIARDGKEILQPKEGFSEYSQLLQTLAFRMSNHVRLITSQGDTLRPSNYYLDRTYASASASQLLFAFPTPTPTGTWRFQLQECGLGTGNLSFLFEAHAVSTAPTLALD